MRAKLKSLLFALCATLVIGAPVVLGVMSGAEAQVSSAPVIQQSGSYTASIAGVCSAGTVNLTFNYVRVGNIVTIRVPGSSCTSNSTLFETAGGAMPTHLRPTNSNFRTALLTNCTDNGVAVACLAEITQVTGEWSIAECGAINSCSFSTWTAAGSKTWPAFTLTYSLR